VFEVGNRVRLAVGGGRRSSEPLGTVIGVQADDIMVRWDVGIERALAPGSLALVSSSEESSSEVDAAA
jgi:hypothetical protein